MVFRCLSRCLLGAPDVGRRPAVFFVHHRVRCGRCRHPVRIDSVFPLKIRPTPTPVFPVTVPCILFPFKNKVQGCLPISKTVSVDVIANLALLTWLLAHIIVSVTPFIQLSLCVVLEKSKRSPTCVAGMSFGGNPRNAHGR